MYLLNDSLRNFKSTLALMGYAITVTKEEFKDNPSELIECTKGEVFLSITLNIDYICFVGSENRSVVFFYHKDDESSTDSLLEVLLENY